MRSVISLALLGACTAPQAVPMPPPAQQTLLLDAPVFRSGETANIHVYGVDAGETVYIVRAGAIGSGPCPPAMRGGCVDVGPQAFLLGSTTANSFGSARLTLDVPVVPHGMPVALQAITLGPTAQTSQPALTVTARRADLHHDDLTAGDLVVTELKPHVINHSQGAWFELHNNTDAIVDLDGLHLEDGYSNVHTLTGTTFVEPHGYAVVAASGDIQETAGLYADAVVDLELYIHDDAVILGPPSDRIDAFFYNDAEFPSDLDQSLQFIGAPDADANDLPATWCDGTFAALDYAATPGAANDLWCTSRTITDHPFSDGPDLGVCEDTCQYANDGECDDGRPGADYDLCGLGTDCADCGPAPVVDPIPDPPTCENSCTTAFDGVCTDGRPGSAGDSCSTGTDCFDCANVEPPEPVENLCIDVPPSPSLSGSACSSSNGRIYVGSIEYASIADAVDHVPTGGTIDICGGTHYVSDLLVDRSMTLRSPVGRATLHGSNVGRVLEILPIYSGGATDITLQNLELRGGQSTTSETWGTALYYGAGTSGHELFLYDVLIAGNSSVQSIVAFNNSMQVWARDLVIRDNTQTSPASHGGILTLHDATLWSEGLEVRDNTSEASAINLLWDAQISADAAVITGNEVASAAVLLQDDASFRACAVDFGVGANENEPADYQYEDRVTNAITWLGDNTSVLCTDTICQ